VREDLGVVCPPKYGSYIVQVKTNKSDILECKHSEPMRCRRLPSPSLIYTVEGKDDIGCKLHIHKKQLR
jgi:hypothetical protein